MAKPVSKSKQLPGPGPGLDRAEFRARIEYEDGLLSSRTNIFLVLNGLAAVAADTDAADAARFSLIATILVTNVLWLVCGIQTRTVIKALTRRYVVEFNDPIDRIVRQVLQWWPPIAMPTDILGVYVPTIALLGWLVPVAAPMLCGLLA